MAKSQNERTSGGTGGVKMVMGPNGKLIPAPKVKQPVKKGIINRPGTTGPSGGVSPIVTRPTGMGPGGAGSGTQPYVAPRPSPPPMLPPAAQGRFAPASVNAPTGSTGLFPAKSASYLSAAQGGVSPASVTGGSDPISDPLTGFASAFTQDMLPYIYAQPEILVRELLKQQGLRPDGANSGLLSVMTPYADALTAVRPLAFGGGGPGSESAPINWMAAQLEQARTPGAGGISFGNVLDALKSQTRDPESAAAQFFTAPGMDPIDQYNAAKNTILGAAGATLPPEFQKAMQNAMSSAFLRFMGNMSTGKAEGNFLPFFLDQERGYTRGY